MHIYIYMTNCVNLITWIYMYSSNSQLKKYIYIYIYITESLDDFFWSFNWLDQWFVDWIHWILSYVLTSCALVWFTNDSNWNDSLNPLLDNILDQSFRVSLCFSLLIINNQPRYIEISCFRGCTEIFRVLGQHLHCFHNLEYFNLYSSLRHEHINELLPVNLFLQDCRWLLQPLSSYLPIPVQA